MVFFFVSSKVHSTIVDHDTRYAHEDFTASTDGLPRVLDGRILVLGPHSRPSGPPSQQGFLRTTSHCQDVRANQLPIPSTMSDTSSAHTPRQSQFTPLSQSPVRVVTPHSMDDSSSEHEGIDVHSPGEAEEGYEMRPLKARGKGEEMLGGKPKHDEDDDEGDYSGGDEVLYAIDDDPDPLSRSPRRRMRRREFLYTRAEERAVVRKLDKYLVGGLAVLYMLRYAAETSGMLWGNAH